MVNYETLTKVVNESGIKKQHLAEALHITSQSLRMKLTGKAPFIVTEAADLCAILNLDPLFAYSIFFDSKYQSADNSGARA